MVDDPEIAAMATVSAALAPLDEEAKARVLRWAGDRFGLKQKEAVPPRLAAPVERQAAQPVEHQDVASLFAAAGPTNNAVRALVVAYWWQQIEGHAEWTGYDINSQLRHLGYRLDNITDTLTSLISRTPSLVIQTRKSGSTRQARKNYKLTQAGITEVENLVSSARTASEPHGQALAQE